MAFLVFFSGVETYDLTFEDIREQFVKEEQRRRTSSDLLDRSDGLSLVLDSANTASGWCVRHCV